MVDCGSEPPNQLLHMRIAELEKEVKKARARSEKLEKALRTIMLKWNNSKLCAKVAQEALRK